VTTVRIGTRASALATTQTGHVADALTAAGGAEIETVHVRTDGDRLRGSLTQLGGTGVFVTALRDALLEGRCDVAVHSLKDLPTGAAPGLVIAAVPERVDPRDALCARDDHSLETLPRGARVGTGSPRRKAQLLAVRPDLDVVDIRGNVGTRLARITEDLDAVVLAAAGLARLGMLDAATDLLDPTVMLPAAGQGALAVECRAGEQDVIPGLTALDHLPTRLAVAAERALLEHLEAGCAAPVGALGLVDGATLRLVSVVAALDGSSVLRDHREVALGPDPVAQAVALGREAATDLLAQGAAALAPVGPAGRE
jgi:hydroxymethylbilane synthase